MPQYTSFTWSNRSCRYRRHFNGGGCYIASCCVSARNRARPNISSPNVDYPSAPANQSPNLEVGRLLADLSREDAREAFEVSETARHLAEVAPTSLSEGLLESRKQPQEDLRKLETPTLIIGHDIDYINPLSCAASLSQLIPRSQLVVITPKAVSKPASLKDFHTAIAIFLETFFKYLKTHRPVSYPPNMPGSRRIFP
jgi:hypothetical protein